MTTVEDGLCCPRCSTEECVVSYPRGTRECPTCGETELLESAVVVAKIRKMMDLAIRAACPGMVEGTSR